MNDMLYKLLKEAKPEEQEIQRKGLSPAFISFLVKLVLSVPAAQMFSFLSLAFMINTGLLKGNIHSWWWLSMILLGLISALILIIAPKNRIMETKIVKIVLWVLFLAITAWDTIGYLGEGFLGGVSNLLPTLIFALALAVMMLLFASYKVGGIDEGWTIDRATGAEKLAISLWILSLVLMIFLTFTYSQAMLTSTYPQDILGSVFRGLIMVGSYLSIPLAITLLVVFLVNVMSIRKNRLSKIKELAMKEARKNKD